MNRRILITGGLGFIGSHVAKEFCKEDVIIIDLPEKVNSYSGRLTKTCRLMGCDVSNWNEIEELGIKNLDLIIHCAAQSGGFGGLKTPQRDCDWNAKGTLNICELAILTGKPKIIYTSSVAVYGGGDNLNEDNRLTPVSNYGVSKLAGEMYLDRYKHRGIDSVSLRVFNTYGPGQDLNNKHQGLVSIFLEQLLHNEEVRMTGSPKRYRDCIHITDVVSAIRIVADKKESIQGAINVCNQEGVTMERIVNVLAFIMNKEAVITNIGGYPGDQFGYYGNNNKLRALGWSPQFDLVSGFRDFYNSTLKGSDEV